MPPKPGWLIEQIDLAEKDIEAWPDWMKDLRIRISNDHAKTKKLEMSYQTQSTK
jgi:hypothetical protein